MNDSYRTITTLFRGATEKAVCIDMPAVRGGGIAWVPRSLIHGVDDKRLDGTPVNSEVTFRLVEWRAEQMGFPA